MSMQPTGYNLPTFSKAPDASVRLSNTFGTADWVTSSLKFWNIMGQNVDNRSTVSDSYEHSTAYLHHVIYHRPHQSEY